MSTDKHLILWVDDTPDRVASHVLELEEDARLVVQQIRRAEEALKYIDGGDSAAPALLIWDLIMPKSRLSRGAKTGSLLAGELVFERFRARWREVPAILFTNAIEAETHRRYDTPQDRSWSFEKRDLDPSAMRKLVLEILGLGEVRYVH